jgi:hypothetical protein
MSGSPGREEGLFTMAMAKAAAKKKLKVGIIGVGGISGVHYSGYSKC